jgi:release factor glutamine methyltransferase
MVRDEHGAGLAAGDPLAYVIGWIPFLSLRINLSSKPLIPRPETEWWTERLISHLKERFGGMPFRFLDLCAGSGAIGLSVLAQFPQAQVSFGELMPKHCEQIRKNVALNGLDSARATIVTSDLFAGFTDERFDCIASNPPYIPSGRELPPSVASFEPTNALYAGSDGLEIIRSIANATQSHLEKDGELWLECDVENIAAAKELLERAAQPGMARTEILTDLYGRPRVVVSYYS